MKPPRRRQYRSPFIGTYILKGKLAVPVKDPLEWGRQFEKSARIVKQTNFNNVDPWLKRDIIRHRDANTSRARLGMSSLSTDPRFAAQSILISTVFLGLDMGFGHPKRDPLLFETMVFNGPLNEEMDRYSSWVEAEAGHEAMCDRVRVAMLAERVNAVEISPEEK